MGYAVGLMSGTSLDGVDAALVEITGTGPDCQVRLIDFLTLPFSQSERADIMAALMVESSNVQNICSLNFSLSYKFAEGVKTICQKNGFDPRKLDVVGSHGQTLYHQPMSEGRLLPSTLQVGEPAVIAYETGAKVVSNFRSMDMAAGGQGAPLVPYTEWVLYRHPLKSRLLQNIGGIGNVTVLPAGKGLDHVWAFDTGPGNMVMDEVCRQLFGLPYDEGGLLAAAGTVDPILLSELLAHPYFSEKPPKSTGRELFGREFVADLLKKWAHVKPHDLLATVTQFTARTIGDAYQAFIFGREDVQEVIVGGGGSYNKTLLSMMSQLLGPGIEVMVQEDLGYSSDAKEAVAFALLAWETLHQNPSNAPRATGAREPVILGSLTLPPFK